MNGQRVSLFEVFLNLPFIGTSFCLLRLILAVVVLLVFPFLLLPVEKADAEDILSRLGASFIAHFDQEVLVDPSLQAATFQVEIRLVSDRIVGKAFRLKKEEHLVLSSEKVLNPTGSAIVFLVRPNWSGEDPGSHTILSFRWQDARTSWVTKELSPATTSF